MRENFDQLISELSEKKEDARRKGFVTLSFAESCEWLEILKNIRALLKTEEKD
jgi:hypothetical protein